MRFYKVLVADSRYHNDAPLTYSSTEKLSPMTAVSVPLRQRLASGFVLEETAKPDFQAKPIKSVVSTVPLPSYCLRLAEWLADYYACSLAEALRQYAPSRPPIKSLAEPAADDPILQTELKSPLTAEQKNALKQIRSSSGTTLLHGETGSGKTRIYMELAKETLAAGQSVIMLTPEISLTSQLAATAKKFLGVQVYVIHSQLSVSQRKKLWRQLLEAKDPVIVIGPRSALFTPLKEIGLIVIDEAHEPAYKQSQTPRYHAVRAASQLGRLTGAKVVLGSATPAITDYFLAEAKGAIARMAKPAIKSAYTVEMELVDIKERANFSRHPYLSNQLIDAIKTTLSAKKQVLIYLNRRGSARLILCSSCGWQLVCPHCDIPLVYHGDEHLARCHSCGYKTEPPLKCPQCGNTDIIYRSVGTKALADELKKLFPHANVKRFDSDNQAGERLNELFSDVVRGKIDILVGTQLLAKGLDLPKLGLVGIISAETSLSLPDFTAEERAFQLLYQVIGRVGRGHGHSRVIIQTIDSKSPLIQSVTKKNWNDFYNYVLDQRRAFRFPPFSYLAQLVCRRSSTEAAYKAAQELKAKLSNLQLRIEVIGPAQPFYSKKGPNYYYQLVVKTKNRSDLAKVVEAVPSGWQINLDPINLL